MEFYYILLLPITVILGWVMTFIFSGHCHQLHDRILLALILCGIIPVYVTCRELVVPTIDYAFIILQDIETFFALIIFPLAFLYIRTVVREARWCRWYYWLFAPGVIIWVAGTVLSFVIGWDRILEIRLAHDSIFVPDPDSIAENLYLWIYIIIYDLTLEMTSVVLIGWCVYYLVRYHKHACNFYANLEDSSMRRIHYFLLFSIGIFATVFFVTFFIRVLLYVSNVVILGISLCLSALIYGLSYNAYKIRLTDKHLEVLELVNEPDTIDLTPQSTVVLDETLELKISAWVNAEDKPFTKEGLTVADVAKDMNINPRVLSRYINANRGMNFNHWINTLRIEEAKRILVESPDWKISYVSAICGFTDQSVFSKTFHTLVGCSPQTFRDSKGNVK